MPAGRPSDYNEEVLETARAYLDNFESYEHAIPSVAGLAKVLGKHRDTLYGWAEDEAKSEFSYILSQIVSNQELVLLNKGLKGEFNSNICKLALGKHGYSEKKDLKTTGDVTVKIVQFDNTTE